MGTVTATAIPSQAASTGHKPTIAPNAVVVASNLHNPRGVRVQPDGSLVVAEAGTTLATCPPPPANQRNSCLGFTGSLYRVAGSSKGRVVTGLPSEQINQDYGTSVLTRVAGAVQADYAGDGTFQVSYGLSGAPADRAALGAGSEPLGSLSTSKGKVLGDLAEHELEHNPDAADGITGGPFSNPWEFAKDGKDFLVTDAGANDLIRVHADGTTSTEFLFPNNISANPATSDPQTPVGQLQAVPTGIVRGHDGAFYIADMSGMEQGKSRIWRYVPGSQPTVIATGLTDVLGLALDPHSNDLIALSYGTGTSSNPGPGALNRISTSTGAVTAIQTTTPLVAPAGLAVTSNGDVYVTSNTQGSTGELLKFPAS
ncbi:ScyD/ScyE family protein [Streptomyces sp. MMG1121]|uniref:ScyD/ScyE family protein n=1 Tax=Streptomyces sp. MMG1121 TaxID=1415544 RepID=UPI0006ADD0E8|nr:ScyD/ScyE family protein [Streptomyces sp. MMG1121]KOV57746.1 hypothetical protein ADK64_38205 [Streptomyces sp. MMG1121]